MASARASSLWERDVEGPVTQGGTGKMGGGIRRGNVKDSETWLGKVLGRVGNSPRLIIIGVFSCNEISITTSFATSPAMASGMTWGDDSSRKERLLYPS